MGMRVLLDPSSGKRPIFPKHGEFGGEGRFRKGAESPHPGLGNPVFEIKGISLLACGGGGFMAPFQISGPPFIWWVGS